MKRSLVWQLAIGLLSGGILFGLGGCGEQQTAKTGTAQARITSYNVCYTKLLRSESFRRAATISSMEA